MATPSAEQLRAALDALGIEFAPGDIAHLAPERQQTALLAVLTAYSLAHLNNHTQTGDPIDLANRARMHVAGAAEAVSVDAESVMALVLYMMLWCHDLVDELGHDAEIGTSVAPSILDLLKGAMALLSTWAEAQAKAGMELMPGRVYHAIDGDSVAEALHHILDASGALHALLPPAEG